MQNIGMRVAVSLLLLVWVSGRLAGQMKGHVYDAENNQPLEGVLVLHKQDVLATSNGSGFFYAKSAGEGDTLRFKHMGYLEQMVVPKQKDSSLVVHLSSNPTQLGDIVIRAYTQNQRLFNAPPSLGAVTSPDISGISLHRPDEVLNSIPGIMMHRGARNTNRITIRGVGARSQYTTTKIKAYLNQIPLTSGTGETTVEDIDLQLANRITVLKGPAASGYGAALGGTLLYHMGAPSGKGVTINQQASVSSFNTLRNTSVISWTDQHTAVRLAYSRRKSNGWRKNDDYNRDAITLTADHQLNNALRLRYLGRWHKVKAFIPSSLNRSDFKQNPAAAAQSWNAVSGFEQYNKWLQGLTLESEIMPKLQNETSLYTKHYAGNEVRPFNTLDDAANVYGMRTRFAAQPRVPAGVLNLQAGGEVYNEGYNWQVFETLDGGSRGEGLTENRQIRLRTDVFAAVEWQWNGLTLNTGMNVNKTGYRYKDETQDDQNLSDQKYYDWIFSPRFSVSYALLKHLRLYGNISHGFSTPAYEETLNADGFVMEAIKPETGWNRELGAKVRFWDKRLSWQVTAYSMQIKNLLVTRRITEGTFYKINAGKTLNQGVETNLRAHLWQHAPLSTSWQIGYTLAHYQFQDFQENGMDYSGNRLPGIPRHHMHIHGQLSLLKQWILHANYFYAGRMAMDDANSVFYQGYKKLNARLTYRMETGGKWFFKLFAGVNNLTDASFASMILVNAPSFGGSAPRYYYPAPPRHIQAGIQIRFQ